MKPIHLLVALLFSFLSLNVQAAGSAMNEDFTNLIALSKSAIETGKGNDTAAFLEKVNLAIDAYKAQEKETKSYSIHLPRAGNHLKAALKAAKAGNIAEGVTDLENAIMRIKR
ncbi:hypothetical protein A1507_11170 [Methylomonas koyamae]|uniref:Small metal-binding protein n=1 Tax=Methylomonas koyamae TaxID=702114 RepID=A0A177NHV6_9GAMM|nr:small metal-binding protein SmbP [Methylomonas koyamae]OAI17164.1 hypothetical protein A1507_11170 [Methylomonas koyamae]